MAEYKKDTHGAAGEEWYGFDLDGTLAVYTEWKGIDHIGDPVKPMVDLIKKMHKDGKKVKILTARVAPRDKPDTKPNPYIGADAVPKTKMYAKAEWGAADFITDWCMKHLGFVPEITHEKDHLMLELYDDRVKQVIPNKGILVEDLVKQRSAQDLAAMFIGRAFLTRHSKGQ